MMRRGREEQRLMRWKEETDAAREAEAHRRAEEGAQERAVQAAWPPPTAHAALPVCLVCGSGDLVETRDSAVMMTVKDRPDASYVDYPTLINFVVCRHCGHLELFANDIKAFLSSYQHEEQTPRSLPPISRRSQAPPQQTEVAVPAVTGSGPGAGLATSPSKPDTSAEFARPAAKEQQATEAVPEVAPAGRDEIKAEGRRAARRIEKIDRKH
jgi:hypothetical protein